MDHSVNYMSAYDVESDEKSVTLLYRKLPELRSLVLADRISVVSSKFLDCPYLFGAAGEGHKGRFDQAPLYRLDSFDCVTYLNVVIALALSSDILSFRENLIRIGYCDAQLKYENRHHFMSVDWNFHNQALGLVEDITESVLDVDDSPVVRYAHALIDRPNWFRFRTYQDIRLLKRISKNEEFCLMEKLHNLSTVLESKNSHLAYLPIQSFFDESANPKMEMFQKLPHGSVLEIVRPNWDLSKKIGTNMNVSHVGFVVKKNEDLFFRQASLIEKCVCDVSLITYLRDRLESPSIKGVNIQELFEI